MQVHAVFADHPAEPGSAVEAHVDLAGFLDHHFQAPRFELFLHPGFCLGQGSGADEASADAVGQEIGVFHRPVVSGSGLDDFLDNFVLRECAEGAAGGDERRKCEGNSSLHGKVILYKIQI